MASIPHNDALRAFIYRLSRSRFFTISVALHFLLVLTAGSVVLVRNVTQKPEFEDVGGSLVAPEASAPAPEPVQVLQQQPTEVSVATAPSTLPSLSAITTTSLTPSSFALPSAPITPQTDTARTITTLTSTATANAPTPTFSGMTPTIAKGMKGFTQAWKAQGDSGSGVGKDRRFKFTAYVAKYSGGDWDATIRVENGKITQGSLPNLLYCMRRWSSNKIEAAAEAVPLDIASDQLFAIKPPFIFFTGHKDFKLTDKEVENLTKYLNLGGAIWGDSSLPGKRSRFDIAFRREMKRVLPDEDKQWEALPPDHAIFTKAYFPEIRTVPPGINYYQEPVYALKIFGEIAVLYTANDYGDMWQMGLNEKGEIDTSRDAKLNYVAINRQLYLLRDLYYRNLEVKAINDSYRFGTNIILHLLTRWEDKLRNVPTGL
jgi:hypothetical protein